MMVGLLTPLYLAGLAALSLPVLFHLIRRTPRGRQAFGSLMFLSPSPPRLTRRSRLDHLWLLCLRLAALGLLALAFARPFLRQIAALPLNERASRRVAILLDASASMRRGDLWRQAAGKVEGALEDLSPQDDVALFTFDDRPHAIVDFARDADEPTAGKPDLVRQRLQGIKPSWGSTDLAAALVAVAGELDTFDDERRLASAPQMVLITDLARGSRTDALEAYKWPEKVPVVVHALAPKKPTNAAAHLLADDEQRAPGEPRVRVTNAANSTRDEFFVGWSSLKKPAAHEPLAIYVPAGQSRVVRLPRPTGEASADRLELRGDEADFDNTYYVVPLRQQIVKAAWFGAAADDDAKSLRYYFDLAVSDDPLREVEMQTYRADEPWPPAGADRPALIVATEAIPPQVHDALTGYLRAGGTLLMVLKDRAGAESLKPLLDDVSPVETAAGDDGAQPGERRQYQMLGEIDFAHPLFAAFANPRYSDFTKIHFWRHQALAVEPSGQTRVVARFDNGDPAVLERTVGAGRVLAFSSGWRPEDSQLALSSKFVPLMQALLELACGGPAPAAHLTVGQPMPLPDRSGTQTIVIEKPDGATTALAADAQTFTGADRPGIYRLRLGGDDYSFAVNIASAESDTAPMELDRLEHLGVRFSAVPTRAERAEQLRQQRDTELESRQRLWRWLIVAAIALLVLETWLAGRAARRLAIEPPTPA